MKLLLDAQLPRRLAHQFGAIGHDAVHVFEFPQGNRTPDTAITASAVHQARIVVTKDADFVASFWLRRLPPKLLPISTGNIPNDELWQLIAANLPALELAFAQHDFVELSGTTLTVHA